MRARLQWDGAFGADSRLAERWAPRARLADRADMDVSHLARIESGDGNPTLFVLIQLATALDVKPEVFITGLTAADLPENLKPYSEADFRRELRRREGA